MVIYSQLPPPEKKMLTCLACQNREFSDVGSGQNYSNAAAPAVLFQAGQQAQAQHVRPVQSIDVLRQRHKASLPFPRSCAYYIQSMTYLSRART